MKIFGAFVATIGIITNVNANVASIEWMSLVGAAMIGSGLVAMACDWK